MRIRTEGELFRKNLSLAKAMMGMQDNNLECTMEKLDSIELVEIKDLRNFLLCRLKQQNPNNTPGSFLETNGWNCAIHELVKEINQCMIKKENSELAENTKGDDE